jgi:hypothetical protein
MNRRMSGPWSYRGGLAAAAALGLSVIVGGAGLPASASVSKPASGPVGCGNGCEIIDEYNNGGTDCQNIDPSRYTYYCLWYSPDMKGGHWLGPDSGNGSIATLTGSFTGGDGPIRNNAASAANVLDCAMGIWVSPNYVGDENQLYWGWGGNLTSSPPLRNNEASIGLECDA